MTERDATGSLTVLLVGQGQSEMGSLQAQLEALNCELIVCERGRDAPRVVTARPIDVVIVDVTSPGVEGVRTCQLIKQACLPRQIESGSDVPVLLATLRADSNTRTRGAEVGADGFINKPIEVDELRSQMELVHRSFQLTAQLRKENSRTDQLNTQLLAARTALDNELHLAHRLQGSLLPQSLPQYPNLVFAATLRPSGAVSGDFYDVFRLDEKTVGFYVADAIGHGVPAALLTIFIKKGIQTKDITGNSYRLLSPGEALERLNDDIIEAALSDSPFVTMFYGTIDLDTLKVNCSTGGHPPPILLHADGSSEFVEVEGPLLGIFREPFPVSSTQLLAGDRLVVYSDGLDDAAGPNGLTGIDWLKALYIKHAELPLDEQVGAVMDELFNCPSGENQRDDTTMLVLQAPATE